MFRIGQSTDVHQLTQGRDLILGGVHIPYEKGCLGHSDADCLLHVICEAIIGALGKGDLGTHFPDTDPKYKGVDSMVLLEASYQMMIEDGYQIGNVDALMMIEKPKMAPHIPQMIQNVAKCLHCDPKMINIKATTSEKMGYVGRGEGVLCQAVILIQK